MMGWSSVDLDIAPASKLGHLGPDLAILGEPQNIDASEGELETIIDGHSTRWKIRITSPITAAEMRFTFEAV
jgi:hypothetical protein